MTSDSVDKYNHTWMVLLFLVLSLTSFIVPLHPSYHDQDQESITLTPKQPEIKQVSEPQKFKVNCWAPAEFTHSYVEYANAYCENAFISALNGKPNAEVYEMTDFDHMNENFENENRMSFSQPFKSYFDAKSEIDKTNKEGYENMLKSYVNTKSRVEETNKEREEVKGRIQKLVTFHTPIVLLVVAICLVLPQVVWCLLSECCSPFNVDQTLESAKMANSGDYSTGQQFYQNISASVIRCIRSSPKTTSVLYLTKKCVSVLVVIALILVVSEHALPQVNTLNKDLDRIPPPVVDNYGLTNIEYTDQKSQYSKMLSDLLSKINNVFICGLRIKQVQNIQYFSFQCAIQSIEEKEDAKERPASSPPMSSTTEKSLLDFQCLLYHFALALLVILAVANVLSLCSWILKLMTASSKTSLGLSTNTAMDVVFLVQMARINTSPHVTHGLAQSCVGFENVDETELLEGKSSRI